MSFDFNKVAFTAAFTEGAYLCKLVAPSEATLKKLEGLQPTAFTGVYDCEDYLALVFEVQKGDFKGRQFVRRCYFSMKNGEQQCYDLSKITQGVGKQLGLKKDVSFSDILNLMMAKPFIMYYGQDQWTDESTGETKSTPKWYSDERDFRKVSEASASLIEKLSI